MTLGELVVKVSELRPNQYGEDHMTSWVNAIEARAARDVINKAADTDDVDFRPYTYDADVGRELLIPDEHSMVYESYLMSMIDFANGEFDRYNADAALHEAAWQDYAAEYRREHMPKHHESALHPVIPSEG